MGMNCFILEDKTADMKSRGSTKEVVLVDKSSLSLFVQMLINKVRLVQILGVKASFCGDLYSWLPSAQQN